MPQDFNTSSISYDSQVVAYEISHSDTGANKQPMRNGQHISRSEEAADYAAIVASEKGKPVVYAGQFRSKDASYSVYMPGNPQPYQVHMEGTRYGPEHAVRLVNALQNGGLTYDNPGVTAIINSPPQSGVRQTMVCEGEFYHSVTLAPMFSQPPEVALARVQDEYGVNGTAVKPVYFEVRGNGVTPDVAAVYRGGKIVHHVELESAEGRVPYSSTIRASKSPETSRPTYGTKQGIHNEYAAARREEQDTWAKAALQSSGSQVYLGGESTTPKPSLGHAELVRPTTGTTS